MTSMTKEDMTIPMQPMETVAVRGGHQAVEHAAVSSASTRSTVSARFAAHPLHELHDRKVGRDATGDVASMSN